MVPVSVDPSVVATLDGYTKQRGILRSGAKGSGIRELISQDNLAVALTEGWRPDSHQRVHTFS